MAWYRKSVTENPSFSQNQTTSSSQTPQQQQAASSQIPGEKIVQMVNKSVNSIMTRLHNMAAFEGADSKAATLVASANSPDNLCRMDPAWHPWL